MARRNRLGSLLLAAVAFCALAACNKKPAAGELDARCEQLAKTCGDKDKHSDKLLEECKDAAAKQIDKCKDKALAAYDCYEKELCGGADKVWALDDFRVLADRHKKCTGERDALRDCMK
jgi:hypothetical protein